MMDIVEKILRQHELSIFNPEQMAIFDLPDEEFVPWKEAAEEIERLREALWDLEQYVSRADHFYLKPETLATLKEVE